MSQSPKARVVADGLAHRFPGTDILFEGVSFTINPGDVLGLCGPSGSGKSTILSIIAGWEKPWQGQIRLNDCKRLGWVFQNPHGVAERSTLDHVVYPLLAKGMRRKQAEQKALEVMEEFSLAEVKKRPFYALSGGEAQRLMLARAVCQKPDVLLVDEPTAQLDSRTAATVTSTLHILAERGLAVVMATHDTLARSRCTQVIDLLDYTPGNVIAQSSTEPLAGNEPQTQSLRSQWRRR
ncbi:MAG: ATP-binding cassette domain-containing protein [Propionibacteriaceae bacterium]|jgi:ABC-type lipoprotein export system ATPase subunit|nr:ATP-binding cassette domain-containing protein [Propionibacteriaceae bacterium]